jgi:TolA-binding protein
MGIARRGDALEPCWKAALEKASVRSWDKAAESPSAAVLLMEGVLWSVTKGGELPRPSEVVAVPELAPYLQAMEEEPDEVKSLAALSAVEKLCAEKGRTDLAGLIEATTALRWGSAKVGESAAQLLANRIKGELPAGDDKEKLPSAVKSLLETGSVDSARAVAEFTERAPRDSELPCELNAIIFASLPTSSDVRRRAGMFLADRAASGGGLASWAAAHGDRKLAVPMLIELVELTEDSTAVARLWTSLADGFAAENEARRAASFYLAAADVEDQPQARKTSREEALSILAQSGQEQTALDMCGRLIGPDVSEPALKEFLGKAGSRAQEELPVLKARVLRSPNTEVGCLALARALRYAPVTAGAVDDLCREVVSATPESRAAALVLLAKSEQLCWQGSFADAFALLDRLPEARTPSDLRSLRIERVGDCCLAQGRLREAAEAYRNAAKEYYYEYEMGGFGFFGLKKHSLSADTSAEDQKADAECLKGYLELAEGRTYEGTARLERIVFDLRRLPVESEIRKLRLPDARFLLAVAWLEEGADELGASEGRAAIQAASRDLEQRESLFAFAQMLGQRTSPEQAQITTAPATAAGTAGGNPLAQATAAVQKGNYVSARAQYKRILDSLKEHDARTVLETCNGVLLCFVKESQSDFETAATRFREWAARSLPEGYEGCATLAMARACYQRSDFQGAIERIQDFLTAGDDVYLIAQAHLLDGLIKFKSGQTAEALPCFEEALAHAAPDDPASAEPLFLVGYISMVNGDSDRARKSFEALLKQFPGSSYVPRCRELLDRLKTTEAKTATQTTTTGKP